MLQGCAGLHLDRIASIFKLVLAAHFPLSSLYLHLPASFEAVSMKGTQHKAQQNQKCQRTDHLSAIQSGLRSQPR